MQKFFVRASDIRDGYVTLSGSDGVHVSRSLRMAKGDKIAVCDMQRREYDCVIEDFTGVGHTDVLLRIVGSRSSDTEPPCLITLFQALPKSDKMDYIVQKAVELGVSKIVPVLTERSVSRPDEKSSAKKTERWRRIAKEAAVQCGRGIVPEVAENVGFEEAVDSMVSGVYGLSFMCYEGEGTRPLPEQRHERLHHKTVRPRCPVCKNLQIRWPKG